MERVPVPQLVLFACCLISTVESQQGSCVAGKWDPPGCQKICPQYCAGSICAGSNGHCAVCKSGYYGDKCDKTCENCQGGCTKANGHCTNCKPGFWGTQKCEHRCSIHCVSPTCQRANGYCSVCKSGYYGDKCDKTCDNCQGGCNKANGHCTNCKPGFWGTQKCEHRCSTHCVSPTCQRANGYCSACKTGYFGDKCDKTCDNCLDGCTKANGHCTNCKPGFWDTQKCEHRCSTHCVSPTCQRTNGYCSACVDRRYGNMCNASCSQGCARCDQQSGNCTACDANSNLEFPGCTECEDGYYKQSAPPCIQCPGTCDNNTPCDKTTGHCAECPPGRKGNTCNQECQPGLYGEGCSRACGYCQVNTTCHHQDGRCLAGCVSGFAEPLCLQVQVKQESWVVPVVGSLAAALLITVGVVAIMCWCRRSREATEENHQRVAPPVEPESTQDRDRPSSAPPISDADTTVYEIIDNDDAEEMHVQLNTYEIPHPYSNDDADRALYTSLPPLASDDAS